MEHRDQRIVAETTRYRIEGILRLPRDGYRSRVTDYLNSGERSFIALTDVELEPIDGSEPKASHPFMALALRHIVLVSQAD